ncbi:HAMP domain-containing histidine kinase [Paenibacillus sp. N1-5-1-14]|uniref:sensor histidine kinase n=1 Tax=Paenibacillus radicibacter TaxID=2972488 RepID=UPI002158A306|nr:HAMP domain-containing sensor histidine kinase [Paenibacillus radicibacter]MCR8644836.1 HAMP domain-containing histidine kinase [Paenibacillus radicibacter]
MSLRLRLTLWYSSILAVTMLIFGMGLYMFLNFFLMDSLERGLAETTAQMNRHLITNYNFQKMEAEIELKDTKTIRESLYFFQVYNFRAKSYSLSANLRNNPLPITDDDIKRIKEEDEPFSKKVTMGNNVLLVYYMPLTVTLQDERGRPAAVLQTAMEITPFESFFVAFKKILFTLGGLCIVIAASLGMFLSRKALKPIDQIIKTTNAIGTGNDLNKRIPYAGPPDEIGRLVETINGMLGRLNTMYSELDEAYLAQRQFVSDASHELRTPLTTIRGNVDLLEKMWKNMQGETKNDGLRDEDRLDMSIEAMQDIAGEAQRMSRLVNDLLALARADAGVIMEMKHLELKPLLEEVVRRAQMLPRTAEWHYSIEDAEGIYVKGNRDYLQQLMFIFIENAFKYTEEGVVSFEIQRHEHQIGICIVDTGMGMDKEEVPRIFDRFYRADVSRGITTGTGLGLSIAKWIIDEHHGSVEVMTRKNEGSTFIVWLPLSFPVIEQ